MVKKRNWLNEYAAWRRKSVLFEDDFATAIAAVSRLLQVLFSAAGIVCYMSLGTIDSLIIRILVFLIIGHLLVSVSYRLFEKKNVGVNVVALAVLVSFLLTAIFPLMLFVHVLDFYILETDLGEVTPFVS